MVVVAMLTVMMIMAFNVQIEYNLIEFIFHIQVAPEPGSYARKHSPLQRPFLDMAGCIWKQILTKKKLTTIEIHLKNQFIIIPLMCIFFFLS